MSQMLSYRDGAADHPGFWGHPVGKCFGWTIRLIAVLGVMVFTLVVLIALSIFGFVGWQEATWSRDSEQASSGLIRELGTLGPGKAFHASGIRVADKTTEAERHQTWYEFQLPPAEIPAYRQAMKGAWQKKAGHSVDDRGEHADGHNGQGPWWWDGREFNEGDRFTLDVAGESLFHVAMTKSGMVMIRVGR